MTLARFGDNAAFAEIVNRNKDMVVNYLARLTGIEGDAEDLAQETFLRLFSSAGAYRKESKFKGYLMKIATNIALNHFKKVRRQRALFGLFTAEHTSRRVDKTPQTDLLIEEADHILGEAIAKLPWRFRVPLVLREIEELPYDTISDVLGCSKGTVKSRISRGRSRLKVSLASYLDGAEK